MYLVHILCIQGFYEEVATPLLTDVTMVYVGGTNLTQTNFSQYYNGSEIVVAGQINDNDIETFTPQVVAISVRLNIAHQLESSKRFVRVPLFTHKTFHLDYDRTIKRWCFRTQPPLLRHLEQRLTATSRGSGPTSQ